MLAHFNLHESSYVCDRAPALLDLGALEANPWGPEFGLAAGTAALLNAIVHTAGGCRAGSWPRPSIPGPTSATERINTNMPGWSDFLNAIWQKIVRQLAQEHSMIAG